MEVPETSENPSQSSYHPEAHTEFGSIIIYYIDIYIYYIILYIELLSPPCCGSLRTAGNSWPVER